MVVFSIEYQDLAYSKNGSNNKEPYLIILTNEITNEILKMIDTQRTKNIAFQIPYNNHNGSTKRDITFDFKVDIWVWRNFVREINRLEFRGKLVKKQLTVQHFECMERIRGLYIGSTDYPLFENEDISNLPLIDYVSLNGYGMVICSENMNKWIEKLELNRCLCERCI